MPSWSLFKHVPKKKLVLAVGDSLLVAIGLGVAQLVNPSVVGKLAPVKVQLGVMLCMLYLSFFYLGNLYLPLSPPHQRNKISARILIAVLAATLAAVILLRIIPALGLAVRNVAILSAFMVPAAYLWRWTFERAFIRFLLPVRVLIVGAGWAGTTIGTVLAPIREFRVVGYVDDDPGKRSRQIGSVAVLGTTSDIQAIVERHDPGLIVLAITHEKRGKLFRTMLDCKMNGIELCDMPTLYEELTGRVPVNHVRDSWFVYSSLRGIRKTVYAVRLKRLLDIAFSFFGLVLSLPITILALLAIAIESGSPVLYKQKRAGQHEREFWLVKFRSMSFGAEDGTGAVWAKPKDDRVTKVGRAIRLLRIDEIPQMWNVLKGEMSFIGPRPERPEFVKELNGKIPYYSIRHTIKPGITGWAQVNYPYGASEEDAMEKLQYDLFYLKNMSALLDLHILLRTIRVVFFRQGSR
jgi:sugar transferase (PEP-CTERM system associated)